MDIESLCTDVPFEGGIQAVQFFLDKKAENNPVTKCILELTECILCTNYFLYGTDFYLQISGVAMGSKMSPQY